MRAVRRGERGGISVQHVTERAPEAGESCVSVRSAGICGSDLHAIELGPIPATLGHEVAGVLPDGTAVAVWPLTPCNVCDRCRAGEPQQCRGAQMATFGFARDGGMADRMVVPTTALVPLAPAVPIANACLVEPLACGVHGARRVDLRPHHRVAIVGGGTMGLCLAAVSRSVRCDVAVVARHVRQNEAAEMLGAARSPDGEYDVVVDAAGTRSSIAQAVALARPGATVLLLATYWEGLHIDGMEFALNELTLVPASAHGGHQGARDVDTAAALLASTPTIADALITHRFGLDEAPRAFATAADRRAGAIKVVLEP